ncbi:enhancer of split malpha protein-like [Chrysoperla carnea]|uniref:enhancer of split malpha protein-like n=1 Tax=Chrysoperla carnea TaxID=189513 RepID=UPI001D05E7CE|nr:enhancer of split malpha protein-like [Chrysoperla carnea]
MALINDFVISSNNSINENKYNAKKLSKSKVHKLKQLLKPVFAILKSRKQLKNTYTKSCVDVCETENFDECCIHCQLHENYDSAYESDQNDANEFLEENILNEINQCVDGAAVPVYFNQDSMEIIPIHRGDNYIPVHFAKTEAGTFFWTTMPKQVVLDCDEENDLNCLKAQSEGQLPESQVPCDRWAQA